MFRRPKLAVDQASNISGWMTYKELKWLAKQAQKHQTIVEIGSYQGRSTRALGDNTPGAVYAVDDFIGPRDKQHLALPHFEIFTGNVIDLIQLKKVKVIVADHAHLDLDVRPDMVFIDGSHRYEDVKRDIEIWQPKLIKGGLLCGHDHHLDDIKQALADTVGKYKVARGTTIWYTTV